MVNGIGSYTGSMSYLQFQAPRTRPDPAEMFNKIDTDGSGGISQSELETMAGKTGQSIDAESVISTYDADGDGELSSEEMHSYMESTMQQGLGMMRMPGGQGMHGPGDLFTALDADESGGVSQSELDEWAQNMSDETGNTIDTTDAVTTYDTDGDGVLSSTELQAYLDETSVASSSSLTSKAMSAYASAFGTSRMFNLQDFFMNLDGSGTYTPIDYSV